MRSIVFAVLALFVGSALATGTAPKPSQTYNTNGNKNVNRNTNNNFAVGEGGSSFATGGSSSAGAMSAATTGPVTAGNNLSLEAKSVTAPDVFSYPTAPCRIGIGGSGGNAVVSLGFSGSVLDENCVVMEASRRLQDQGLKAASVQIMCLIPDAKLALEATGTKCLIERKEPVQPEKVAP